MIFKDNENKVLIKVQIIKTDYNVLNLRRYILLKN